MVTCKADQPTMAVSKHDIGWRRVIRNFTPSYVFHYYTFLLDIVRLIAV